MEAAYHTLKKNNSNHALNSSLDANDAASESCTEESSDVIWAENEIEHAFFCLKHKTPKDSDAVIAILINVQKFAHTQCRQPDINKIKDKLFEASLEFALANEKEIAKNILSRVSAPAKPNFCEIISHSLADACFKGIFPSHNTAEKDRCNMVTKLMKDINENTDLKGASYFLGEVYRQGLFGVEKDAASADKYLAIAKNRGYEPHTLKRQWKEYAFMVNAKKNNSSPFFNIPLELINHIAKLRFENILNQGAAHSTPRKT